MFALKVKTRREGAGEPIKYMGCGDCETTSRSMTVWGSLVHMNLIFLGEHSSTYP
jgi:hypothetical protein